MGWSLWCVYRLYPVSGLKDHATDGQGNQITFKKWGEQLHEAFDALETYDPDKARSILNELLQYQIDADITQNLQNIVANIDEVLKARMLSYNKRRVHIWYGIRRFVC